jgi:crotonobetainyl-CoA:carnitine CoA-transferase CaiB-like acyl-CoA transferase
MDILAGHHLKEGLLLALIKRLQTGKGQLVEVSLLQAAVASLANQATNWLVAGVMPEKQGSAHPNIAPYGDVFRTADNREILLAIGTDTQFAALTKILDIDPADVNRYHSNTLRVSNRKALNQLLSEKIALHQIQSLQNLLKAAHIPYGIIRNMQEVLQLENAESLILRSADRTGIKTYAGPNFSLGNSHLLPPPRYGEHTEQVLMQSLEISESDILTLKQAGIIA